MLNYLGQAGDKRYFKTAGEATSDKKYGRPENSKRWQGRWRLQLIDGRGGGDSGYGGGCGRGGDCGHGGGCGRGEGREGRGRKPRYVSSRLEPSHSSDCMNCRSSLGEQIV